MLKARLVEPAVKLLMLVVSPGAAAPQANRVVSEGSGLSTREMLALPPNVADRVTRGDLLSILRPVAPPGKGMFRRLRGVIFETRSYATAFAGVCGRDELTLWYAAPGARPNDPAAPLRPFKVTTRSAFSMARMPQNLEPSLEEGRPEAAQGCEAAAAGVNRDWVGASSAEIAVNGLRALMLSVGDMKVHRLEPQGCGQPIDVCAARIATASDIKNINSVATCEAPTGEACYDIDIFSDATSTLRVRTSLDGDKLGKTISVQINDFIIVT